MRSATRLLAVLGLGCALLGALLWLRRAEISLASIATRFARSAPPLDVALLTFGLVLLVVALSFGIARRRPPQAPALRVLPWWSVALGAVMVLVSTAGTVLWLLNEADRANNASPAEQARIRIEAIRTALTVGAGTGGVVALAIAARRQWLGERAQAHQEAVALDVQHDSNERRITELYTRAVDSLGHERATVRLGGMYALERLAQGDLAHRQTIVDVLCAYLRMPFDASVSYMAQATDVDSTNAYGAGSEAAGELQVRRTAQRILLAHLRIQVEADASPALSGGYWENVRLDLGEATLVEFDLRGCSVGPTNLAGATFHGAARFDGCRFEQGVSLRAAVFNSRVAFDGCVFDGPARFEATHFRDHAGFSGARFHKFTSFSGAEFSSNVSFREAEFYQAAHFNDVVYDAEANFVLVSFHDAVHFGHGLFHGRALFGRARFHRGAGFKQARFDADVRFGRTRFEKRVHFSGASFAADVRFGEAYFASSANFDTATFGGAARFGGATFLGAVRFETSTFNQPAGMERARINVKSQPQQLPPGWVLSPELIAGPQTLALAIPVLEEQRQTGPDLSEGAP